MGPRAIALARPDANRLSHGDDCLGAARAGASTTSPNVNVIAGTGPDGDWTLQRQNEPTIACSSRNPLTCLAGGNDYRSVDIPFPEVGGKVTGDAWLGLYRTTNGGETWTSGLVPGYPQDTSAAGITRRSRRCIRRRPTR